MTRQPLRCAAVVVALTAFAAVVSPHDARADGERSAAHVADDRARFHAAFRFAGTSSEQAARRKAIDDGVHTLFFAIRGIARSRLSAATPIDPWVAFSFDAGNISVRVPTATTVSPANGAAVPYVSKGDRTKLSQRLFNGKLTQVFEAEQGRRVNEWMLSPDARTLSLRVTVSSVKLSRPVIYTLTYARAK